MISISISELFTAAAALSKAAQSECSPADSLTLVRISLAAETEMFVANKAVNRVFRKYSVPVHDRAGRDTGKRTVPKSLQEAYDSEVRPFLATTCHLQVEKLTVEQYENIVRNMPKGMYLTPNDQFSLRPFIAGMEPLSYTRQAEEEEEVVPLSTTPIVLDTDTGVEVDLSSAETGASNGKPN